jgi:hypothetical protein
VQTKGKGKEKGKDKSRQPNDQGAEKVPSEVREHLNLGLNNLNVVDLKWPEDDQDELDKIIVVTKDIEPKLAAVIAKANTLRAAAANVQPKVIPMPVAHDEEEADDELDQFEPEEVPTDGSPE